MDGNACNSDGEPQPIKEVGEWVKHFQLPNWEKRNATEKNAEQSIDEKRLHADEDLRAKVLGIVMNHKASRVSEADKAGVKNLQTEKLAEKKGCAVRERSPREMSAWNDLAWNKKQQRYS